MELDHKFPYDNIRNRRLSDDEHATVLAAVQKEETTTALCLALSKASLSRQPEDRTATITMLKVGDKLKLTHVVCDDESCRLVGVVASGPTKLERYRKKWVCVEF